MHRAASLRPRTAPGLASPGLFLGAHFLAGVTLAVLPALITPLVLIGVGLALVRATYSATPDTAVLAAAYVASSEILWRLHDAAVPWEAGKYGVTALLLMLGFRHLSGGAGGPLTLPAAYFCLLLPSSILTLEALGPGGARELLSFNLSGPLVVAVAAFAFSRLILDRRDLHRLLLVMLGPAVALGGTTLFKSITAEDLTFDTESNFATSGGYGPNQVSLVLGFGALCAFLLAVTGSGVKPRIRALFGLTSIWLTGQAIFTFSRGGVFSLLLAVCVFVLFLARARAGRAMFMAMAGALAFVVVFNVVGSITGGALFDRYEEANTTGRTDIARQDIELFLEHPLAGVGPGMAAEHREGVNAAAHTEFTRLLAEHGAFGLLALVVLLALALTAYRRNRDVLGRAVSAALLLWAASSFLHAAMRLSIAGFVLGLGFATFRLDSSPPRSRRATPAGQLSRPMPRTRPTSAATPRQNPVP